MITERSKKMMVKSFEKTIYRLEEAPVPAFKENYGIYIHVPFCETKCAFCPFYKEFYSEDQKKLYLEALIHEIEQKDISGEPFWIYFGGGTPNTLQIEELSRIIDTLKGKITLPDIGIEILPKLASQTYFKELKNLGFTKISLGIESLKEAVLQKNNREHTQPDRIFELIRYARDLGFWINVDMMVGLPNQSPEAFLEDIQMVSEFGPSQITTYPYMIIRNVKAKASLPNREQFELIEQAGKLLASNDYQRQGIWIFAKGNNVYDSSRDELITDYAGFGPGAFSTYGNWKVVNPKLETYLNNHENKTHLSFVAPKSKGTDHWREFARMLYDVKCAPDKEKFPFYLNTYIRTLELFGFARKGDLTEKGIFFAHEITKTVVESLPFPLQNDCVVEDTGT
jgi:oxygen-independent coproporphyrinogen-3 oxidase